MISSENQQKAGFDLISPSRTYAEFSPNRDYHNLHSYNTSATRTLHKNSSSSIRKLRPPKAPLPKIKHGSHQHQKSSGKMPQVAGADM